MDAHPRSEESQVLYCANHPGRETLLRCNKCNKPICLACAVQTPVGYRCKECVREHQKVYFNAEPRDYPVAFAVGFGVAAVTAPLVGLVVGSLGLVGILVALLVGSGAGSVLAQVVRRAVQRRRGRYLPLVTLTGILLGVLVGNLAFLMATGLFPLLTLPMLVFTVLALAAAYPQLR